MSSEHVDEHVDEHVRWQNFKIIFFCQEIILFIYTKDVHGLLINKRKFIIYNIQIWFLFVCIIIIIYKYIINSKLKII